MAGDITRVVLPAIVPRPTVRYKKTVQVDGRILELECQISPGSRSFSIHTPYASAPPFGVVSGNVEGLTFFAGDLGVELDVFVAEIDQQEQAAKDLQDLPL